jgi:hypothetical protein
MNFWRVASEKAAMRDGCNVSGFETLKKLRGGSTVRVVPHGKELASHRDIAFSGIVGKNKLHFGLR